MWGRAYSALAVGSSGRNAGTRGKKDCDIGVAQHNSYKNLKGTSTILNPKP